MAIQQINLGSMPLGAGGDTQRAANEKINQNFSDQANAASRLVGTASGNVMQVGAGGLLGVTIPKGNISATSQGQNPNLPCGFYSAGDIIGAFVSLRSDHGTLLIGGSTYYGKPPQYAYYNTSAYGGVLDKEGAHTFWTTQNATKDSNGFLKGASPVVDLYDDKIDLNRDAKQQGNITFEKVGTGNYLVKGSLGFAQEGWYIEMPKDANGNVLVAVVYEQLENNDISIKTYDYMLNKKGRIVPDTETPLDIPTGRCINLRLHEVKEQLDEPIE